MKLEAILPLWGMVVHNDRPEFNKKCFIYLDFL